jgi:hypothetical protein
MAKDDTVTSPPSDLGRRDVLKGAIAGAAAVGISVTTPAPHQ